MTDDNATRGDGSITVPLTRMRRAITRAMSASALVPQFVIEFDVSFAALKALREQLAGPQRISYSDFLLAACARTLREHPAVNASFADDCIVRHRDINIAVAVSLEDGLIAPAIHAADTLTLAQLAAERTRLTAAATAGTLQTADILSATFTISNLGPFGVRRFRALVVPPQAAILAVGALTPDGLLSFSLSAEHR